MMKSDNSIHEEMTVEELVDEYPSAVGFLQKEGVVCVKCGEPVWGTLGDTIRRKGLDVQATMAKLRTFIAGGD